MPTSMFLHGGWAHILGSMLFLWIFDDHVESAWGHGLFAALDLLCGIAASLMHSALVGRRLWQRGWTSEA